METLRALIRGDLPPAGYPVCTKKSAAPDYLFTPDYHTHWVDSGTSALALALLDCKLRSPEVTQPQVIIPGYCCPDLVSAAVYAGIEPLVVDIQQHDPAYDLHLLRSALNPNVIAVIAINFLGLRENLTEIRQLISKHTHPVYLIEDNAQWFPDTEQCSFESDYVAFSFGRGKPLSLLGGGVLLTKDAMQVSLELAAGDAFDLKSRAKTFAYNSLLHPHLYCFLNRALFLHLGETRYHPLTKISKAPEAVFAFFTESYRRYRQRRYDAENSFLQNLQPIQQLKAVYTERKGRLLRYPLLVKTADDCTRIYQNLSSAGLGVSRLYQQPLNKIEGVGSKIRCFSELSHAQSFASRLVSLPTHAFVKDHHRQQIIDLVKSSVS